MAQAPTFAKDLEDDRDLGWDAGTADEPHSHGSSTIAASQAECWAGFDAGRQFADRDATLIDKRLVPECCKLSADQGNAYAQFNYGICLYDRSGIEMDKAFAAHYFKLSAD
jgi:TPR repeat protein